MALLENTHRSFPASNLLLHFVARSLGKAAPRNEHGRLLMVIAVRADVVCLGQERVGKHIVRTAGSEEFPAIQKKEASAESCSQPQIMEYHKNPASFLRQRLQQLHELELVIGIESGNRFVNQ